MKLAHLEAEWRDAIGRHLAKSGRGLSDVTTGSEAWNLAHITGMTRDVYRDRTVVDAHIHTLLARIMPNAKFKDRKFY